MSFKKFHYGIEVLTALVFSVLFTIVLPLQTYLGNAEIFTYSLSDILPTILVSFLVVFLVSSVFLLILEPVMGLMPACLLLGMVTCAYLEVGVLSVGLPQINGTLDMFHKPTIRKYLDLGIFAVLFASIFVFYRWLRIYITWFALGLLVMIVASIFDVQRPVQYKKAKTEFDSGFCAAQYEVYKSVEYSKKRNIIVLVLDATPSDMAVEELEKDPELMRHFVGFTAFRNNIGMHEKTIRGVPALVTGEYLQSNEKPHEYLSKFWGEKSFIHTFKHADYAMYVCSTLLPPYTNRQQFNLPPPPERIVNPYFQYTKYEPYINLFDVLKFRIVPYRYKMSAIQAAMKRGHSINYTGKPVGNELNAYKILANQPVSNSIEASFLYFHTAGMIMPCYYDRNAKPIPPTDEPSAYHDYLHLVLSTCGIYFDKLRKKGIYDNSMIVMTTDHGCVTARVVDMPKSALLWIKPFGATNECIVSQSSTSHEKISEVIKKSVIDDLDDKTIEDILTVPVRKLRIKQCTPEKWWYFGRHYETFDIFYDDSGKEMHRDNLGIFEVL